MESQWKLTVYAAGPTESLAEKLAELAGGATVTQTIGYWDPGIGVLSEPAVKIETIVDESHQVILAASLIEGWLGGSDQAAVLVEITPTFARPLYRTD